MAYLSDLSFSLRHPSAGVRRHLSRPRSEPFIFTFLFVFLLLALIGLWPNAAREALLHPETPVEYRMVGAALALFATVPVWYLVAAIVAFVLRRFGSEIGYYHSRLALFWALACIGPFMLLLGMVSGIIGRGMQANLLGLVIFGLFLWLWISMLREVTKND